MPTFADLPNDIVAIISRQRTSNRMMPAWKHSLRILSICRSWRAAILPDVYATVFFIISDDSLLSYLSEPRRFPFRYNAPRTNAGLIYENGYGFMVKHMYINTALSTISPFPWLYVTKGLNIDNVRFPELSAVRKWIEIDTNTIYKSVQHISACINALGPIAQVLVLRFPNVSSMEILGDKGSDLHIDVTSILVSTYSSQLVKVDLKGYKTNPSFLMAANIRYFATSMLNDYYRVPYINPSPCINPKLLICLRLHCDSYKNIWNNFVCDNDTNSIEFTNLEILQLTCGKLDKIFVYSPINWHLKFPKLAHLKIEYGMLINLGFQQTALKLKTLEYEGFGDIAIKDLENNIGGLEKLHLILPIDAYCKVEFEPFILSTNKIFNMVGPIPEVSCTGLEVHSLCMSNIYWPNLTWLELKTGIEPYAFLRSIDRIPHLQHLYLIITSSLHYDDEIGSFGNDVGSNCYEGYAVRNRSIRPNWYSVELSRLSLLKRSEQSQSKLTTLTICWFKREAHNLHLCEIFRKKLGNKGPSLKTILKRQSRCQSKHPFSKYDSTRYNYNCDDLDVPIWEIIMEDAEADAALRKFCPNLVTTKFSYITAKDNPLVVRYR